MSPRTRTLLAKQLYDQRRDRNRMFGELADGFGEPAWDVLLVLYIGHSGGTVIETGPLLTATDVEEGTVATYVRWLIGHGLAETSRPAEPLSGRITLTAAGVELMDAYLDRISAQSEGIGKPH